MKTKNLFLIVATIALTQMTLAQDQADHMANPGLMPMPPKPILIPASEGKSKLVTKKIHGVVYHELTITGEAARPLFNSLLKVIPTSAATTTTIVQKRGENAKCQSVTPLNKPESLSCTMNITDGLFSNYDINPPTVGKPKPVLVATTTSIGLSTGQATAQGVLVTVSGVPPKEKVALDLYNALKTKVVPGDESTSVHAITEKSKNNVACRLSKTKAETSVVCHIRFVGGKAVDPTK